MDLLASEYWTDAEQEQGVVASQGVAEDFWIYYCKARRRHSRPGQDHCASSVALASASVLNEKGQLERNLDWRERLFCSLFLGRREDRLDTLTTGLI
jgi:hypothetical protein